MAARGPSYGFSREVKMKLKSKYDVALEQDLRVWISECTGLDLPCDLSFSECLKDGIVLCTLMDYFEPGSLGKKLPHTKMLNPFRCMENIEAFLKAAAKFGVTMSSLFQTADLYDESNMSQVQMCLLALVDVAKSKGLTESDIGVYVAEKQNRDWSNEQLRAGEGIIGLQAGTNKCASQSGMTPYGAARPAYEKKYTGSGVQKTNGTEGYKH
ncbi:calponin-2-like [Styela clava]|uniref:calponin-2-like n=1 Tax=Styela clava TaxID=7725 RepID=UPI001939E6B4|nr:calponin-2-like [Styela clava]